jgi:hypothetical protein
MQSSLKERISKPEDLQVGLFGPLIGKFHERRQRPPDYSFENSLDDIFLALREGKLMETDRNYVDSQHPQPLFDAIMLLGLIADLRVRFPRAGDREVSD